MENNELELRITTKLDDIDEKINKITNSLNQGGKSAEYFGKAFNFNNVISGLINVSNLSNKLFDTFDDGIDKINDYSETLNLFNLVMGDNLREQANNFQNSMLNAFQNFSTDQLRMQSMFQSMTESLGLTEDYAYIISENMTKLSYDLSSLYNTSQQRASQALQSALVGQTRPVRSYGMDVTQNTISTTLSGIGINDRSVTQLSQVEKELLRYISLLRQSSLSHGDFANTIESPSNQLKILTNQLKEVGKWFGAVFINTVAKALPYINAVVMVLKELLKTLAYLVGYTGEDYNAGLSTYNTDYVDYLDDVGASADSTKGKIKELKREVLGFDQINNINEDTDNSSGTGIGAGSGIGGIDQRLLDALTGYDNLMDKVRLKADKIKDSILKWLGFTKKINPLTGDVLWSYEGISKTLKNMWTSFKKLNTAGKLFVALGLTTVIGKIITDTKRLTSVLGTGGLLSAIKNIFSPISSLTSSIATSVYGFTTLDKSISNVTGGIADGIDTWNQNLKTMDKVKTTLIGASGLLVGWSLVTSAMEEFNETGEYTASVILKELGGALSNVAGGALLGATYFGATGAVIGGTVGAIITLYETYMTLGNSITKTDEIINDSLDSVRTYNESLKEQYDIINGNAVSDISMETAHDTLLSELENIVDANGRIKAGYEDRAKFIVTTLNSAYGTEIEIIDGVIQKYDDQIGSIKKIIDEKRKQIALELAEENYKVAIKEKANAYKNYTEAINSHTSAVENQKNAQEKYNKAYENWVLATQNGVSINAQAALELHKARKELEQTNETLSNSEDVLAGATESYNSNTEAIMSYQGLLSADAEKNAELVEQYINQIENSYYNGSEYVSLTYDEMVEDALFYYSSVLRTSKENEKEITDTVIASAEERLNSLNKNLYEMTNSVEGEMGNGLIEAWGTLAETSESKFLEEFSKLDSDIQTEVVDKMYEKGFDISTELQNGINKINPTIKVKTDTSEANKKIVIDADVSKAASKTNTFWEKVRNVLSSTFSISLPTMGFANGGFPEDGLFFANHSELVGKFSNGKTAVANNNQITQGIKEAVLEALNTSSFGGSQSVKLDIRQDEGIVVKVIDGINTITKTTGESPIDIW